LREHVIPVRLDPPEDSAIQPAGYKDGQADASGKQAHAGKPLVKPCPSLFDVHTEDGLKRWRHRSAVEVRQVNIVRVNSVKRKAEPAPTPVLADVAQDLCHLHGEAKPFGALECLRRRDAKHMRHHQADSTGGRVAECAQLAGVADARAGCVLADTVDELTQVEDRDVVARDDGGEYVSKCPRVDINLRWHRRGLWESPATCERVEPVKPVIECRNRDLRRQLIGEVVNNATERVEHADRMSFIRWQKACHQGKGMAWDLI